MRLHEKFALRHNDWANWAKNVSPVSPDWEPNVLGRFHEMELGRLWRRLEEKAVEMLRKGKR